jgi:hypothetical protein
MNKYLKISELIWLLTAIVGVGIVAYVMTTEGFEGNYYLLILPLMSGVMWMMRRRQRMKFEQGQQKTDKK